MDIDDTSIRFRPTNCDQIEALLDPSDTFFLGHPDRKYKIVCKEKYFKRMRRKIMSRSEYQTLTLRKFQYMNVMIFIIKCVLLFNLAYHIFSTKKIVFLPTSERKVESLFVAFELVLHFLG